jgi:peptidoglycan biosynthesis protein MviN/MurJ (putative lipid II flippase)
MSVKVRLREFAPGFYARTGLEEPVAFGLFCHTMAFRLRKFAPGFYARTGLKEPVLVGLF